MNSQLTNATPLDQKKFNTSTENSVGKRSNSKFGSFLISLSGVMVLFSLIFSYTTIVNSPNKISTNSKASESVNLTPSVDNPEIRKSYSTILSNIPDNPSSVIATSTGSGKIINLKSDQSYPYKDITFTWEKPITREPGTKIIAYFVYFGEKDTEIPFPLPKNDTSIDPKYGGIKTDTNSITFKNLEKGKTYNLFIQSRTDSKNFAYMYGMERLPNFQTLPAKKLFVYTIE